MTTSANIAGTIQPFAVAGHGTGPWPYGKVKIYKIDEIKPSKKKKKGDKLYYGQVGMLYVGTDGKVQEAYTEPVGDPKDNLWKVPSLGKVGQWRTIKGRRYFFPIDGSGPVPKIPGAKKTKKGGGTGLKGLFSKLADKFKGKKSKTFSTKSSIGDMSKKIDSLLVKAKRSKGGKAMKGPLITWFNGAIKARERRSWTTLMCSGKSPQRSSVTSGCE